MSKELKRRQSMIPKPQFNSRNSSPLPSPNNSPTKSSPRRISISPPSPSKLPIINLRKRSSSNHNDYDIQELFKHSQNDLEMQRQELSGLSFNIDTLLATQYQLESEIRDLQRKIEKASSKIQEYEIGIPYNESILKDQSNIIEDEILKYQNKIESQKLALINQFNNKKNQVELSLKEIVDDANEDDEETIANQNKRLNFLETQKTKLLSQIDKAKIDIDTKLQQFMKVLESKREESMTKINDQKISLELELKDVQSNLTDLQQKYNSLNTKEIEYTEKVKQLKIELESKSKNIEKLQYKLNDIDSLIESLEHDFNTASKLRNDFEIGEFAKSKNDWLIAKQKLNLEKYKRLKTELQIKELSGIPNIIICTNDQINHFNTSKLSEFLKPSDHDYKLEMYTALESSLSGVSTLVLYFSENEIDINDIISNLVINLQNIASNQERFSSFDSIITISSSPKLKEILNQKIDLPDSIQGIHVIMNNRESKTSRQAVILIASLNSPEQLSIYLPMFSQLQTFTIAVDISNIWYESLCQIMSIKPLRQRQAFSILND